MTDESRKGCGPYKVASADDNMTVVWRNRALLLFDRVPVPIALCDADGTVLVANPAMATEWRVLPSALRGHNVRELFQPPPHVTLHPIAEAVRLRRRSRYPVEVSWTVPGKRERYGEITVDLVGEDPTRRPNLLLVLRVRNGRTQAEAPARPARLVASAMESKILALAAGGATTAQISQDVGLTVHGVNYHLASLSRRWGAPNRTALVARAYVSGVLAPGTWPPEPARKDVREHRPGRGDRQP